MSDVIHIINGPNLNLLGLREPETYGRITLADIEAACRQQAHDLGLRIVFVQHNSEGALIQAIHEAIRQKAAGIIINAAAYTHTSVAIHDALKAFAGRIIEVHISNVFAREPFRHHSYVSPVADGVICGLGVQGYLLALRAMHAWRERDAGEGAGASARND